MLSVGDIFILSNIFGERRLLKQLSVGGMTLVSVQLDVLRPQRNLVKADMTTN